MAMVYRLITCDSRTRPFLPLLVRFWTCSRRHNSTYISALLMADVRALLKAKRQEARISHPYAAYNASGQLKCSVCGLVIKYGSAWEGHLGSKIHRTNVARMR